MLRALVALLLVANLAFWAWSSGALEGLGLAPSHERDPARLSEQIRPDAVRVLPPSTEPATAGPAPAASATTVSDAETRGLSQCLEAGPFAPALLDAAERALVAAGIPEGTWVRKGQDLAAQFAVVLGPFSSNEALRNKREEIGRLRLPLEALNLPASSPAAASQPVLVLALGRYDSRSAAEAALEGFNRRGVRTARLAELQPARSETRLRVQSASAAQAEQLRALSGGAWGAGFAPCVTTASR